ncbi:MAG: RnfABCDGE type electron transport complex subunit D, partial [Bacilli bacterium]|nr:RnfABCDGE type electron transport complex subunit D [Bacilli bacterium]
MSKRNFVLDKAPYIRKADNKEYGTNVIMKDFVIALLPLIVFAWFKNGLLPFISRDTTSVWNLLRPLILVFIGGFTSYLVEFCYYRFLRREKAIKQRMKTSFALIPGLLLALILPYKTPLWVLILGCLFATLIGKLLFGGFGNNIFNPALVGYLFVTTAFTTLIVGNYLNPSEIVAGATPMATLGSDYSGGVPAALSQYPLWKIFLGLTPGALAETSALLCLISLAYLLIRKVINWRIPVIYLVTVFVLTYIIGAFNGY